MISKLRFTGTFFQSVDHDFGECPDEDKWEKHLAKQGWAMLGHFPSHENWQNGDVTIYAYRFDRTPVPLVGRFLFEVLVHDQTLAEVFCSSASEFLWFLRDWVLPLTAGSHRDIASDTLIEASKNLFDGATGLECAQRYDEREKRRMNTLRYQREAKAAAKASSRTPSEEA